MRQARWLGTALLGMLLAAAPLAAVEGGPEEKNAAGLEEWLAAVEAGLVTLGEVAAAGDVREARSVALRLYLDYFERIEGYYGPGAPYGVEPLAELVAGAEGRFHALLRGGAGAQELQAVAMALGRDVERIRSAARAAGVPFRPEIPVAAAERSNSAGPVAARTTEIRAILDELMAAERSYRAGDAARALALVEHAYLEGIELLEARLPAAQAGRIERLIHLSLRPQITEHSSPGVVDGTFAALRDELLQADATLSAGSTFWFGAISAFAIIVREGLEAVLLVSALLAYLGAVGAGRRYQRRIYAGVALGILASLGTWIAARTLIPIGGANRELLEGITALVAVGVLLYVAHWLFQKAYVHDWKEYLRGQLGRAISTGSAFAMASLAFAAIYREGFETVLFYQALLFDTGSGAVLAGFLPGLVLILAAGVGIIRLGVRLPIKKVFGATNAVLLYLAFVFLGKGIYNLQEAGLFAPRPFAWAPDHEALRLLFGFYPLAETILAQTAFLLLLGATYAYYRRMAAPRTALQPQRTHRGTMPEAEATREEVVAGD